MRIITKIKKPRKQRTSQADKKVLNEPQHLQNTKNLDISEFLVEKSVITDKNWLLLIENLDISEIIKIYLIVCSGFVCSTGGVQRCVKLVM